LQLNGRGCSTISLVGTIGWISFEWTVHTYAVQLALWIRKARASLVRQAISPACVAVALCDCGHTDNSHACNVSR
jgi:hypothetical protein